MPTRIVLSLIVMLLACDVRANDLPASALQVENPQQLELAEILTRWKAASRIGDRPGSRSFRRFTMDPGLARRMPSTFRFDWDGRGSVQFEIDPEAVSASDGAASRTPPGVRQDPHEVWVLSEGRIMMADLSREEFEILRAIEEPAVVRQRRNENWWSGLLFSNSDAWFRVMFANIPRVLVGPGWTGTPENWEDRWDWIIRSQSDRRIILMATPRIDAERDWVSEVTWIIERPTWKTVSVQVVDPRESRDITWRRLDRLVEPGMPHPLLTVERLEAAGFRNLTLPAKEQEAHLQRPADALAPRNWLVW